MVQLLAGCGLLAGTSIFLGALMPRGGRVSRFVGTAVEPFLAIGVAGGFALGFALILSGAVPLLGR